jgi:1-deoxy-D-xylulose-5-phosphate reductoisomerase
MAEMRRVVVLGSTGSIGRQALEVIARHPQRLRVVGLAAHSRIEALAAQMRAFAPRMVAVGNPERAAALARLTGHPSVASGVEGLTALATHPEADVVVFATSGGEALVPLVRAVQAGKRIALASKELLVMAGELIMRLVRERGTSLIPIDSEHAALFQCLQGVPRERVARLTVTGSGGPLWSLPPEQQAAVGREQVLAHPKWQMGPKITVDSATLMNKGLELIEAHWLFGMALERLRVLIHPEAVVHALVELTDGTALAQMSPCDMRLPIQFALSFPERWDAALPPVDLAAAGPLRFIEPDPERFPCLRLAMEAARDGAGACVVLNGANDVAVRAFLENRLPFAEIPRVICETLEQRPAAAALALDDIVALDRWAREVAQERVQGCLAR